MNARELARTLGLKPSGGEYRGDCPACAYPAAFSLTRGGDGRVLGWCASCGDQPAIGAALRAAGAGEAVRPSVSRPEHRTPPGAPERGWARALWDRALPAPGTLADAYLAARALPGEAHRPALRVLPACWHKNAGTHLPAMLARIDDVHGAFAGAHRTYLRPDGSGKADVDPQRASLGPVRGGAIRLDPVAPEVLVAEGIETALSAGRMFSLPAWSAVSAGNMGRALALPPEVRRVVIAADPGAPGEAEASRAAQRWIAEGRSVRIARTGHPARDFNDLLREAATWTA